MEKINSNIEEKSPDDLFMEKLRIYLGKNPGVFLNNSCYINAILTRKNFREKVEKYWDGPMSLIEAYHLARLDNVQ